MPGMRRSESQRIQLTAEVRDGWVLLSMEAEHGPQHVTVRLCPTDAMAMGSRLIELAFLEGAGDDIGGH